MVAQGGTDRAAANFPATHVSHRPVSSFTNTPPPAQLTEGRGVGRRECVGSSVGKGVGTSVGRSVGLFVGGKEGMEVGCGVGSGVGLCVGEKEGMGKGRWGARKKRR